MSTRYLKKRDSCGQKNLRSVLSIDRITNASGGLTKERGLTAQQRVAWLLAMPCCAEVNNVMQDRPGVNYNTGEQNKGMTDAEANKANKANTEH